MDENFLLRLAVACSVLGLVVLYVIAGTMKIDETALNRITNGMSDDSVIVKGKISRITDNDDVMVIELQKTEKISVMMFKGKYPGYLGIREGDSVEVLGKVTDYKGQKEIIAESVRFVG